MERSDSVQLDVPDFGNSVLSHLNQLRVQGRLCDIVVHVEGRGFRAHKAVLAASSPYFRDHASLGRTGAVSLGLIRRACVFERLLAFCYTGRLRLPLADVVSYLTAASFLQMQQVIDRCTRVLEEIHLEMGLARRPEEASVEASVEAGVEAAVKAEPRPGGDLLAVRARPAPLAEDADGSGGVPAEDGRAPDPSPGKTEELPRQGSQGEEEEDEESAMAAAAATTTTTTTTTTPTTDGGDPAGERWYRYNPRLTCVYCCKSFNQKGSLDRHMRLHMGITPFACRLCGKKYTRKDQLEYHIRKHTGNKPFACRLCAKSFPFRAILNQHLRKNHPGHRPPPSSSPPEGPPHRAHADDHGGPG
ncbi:zinc finger and BTB domain-containing protein 37 [Stigmatopora nigra]